MRKIIYSILAAFLFLSCANNLLVLNDLHSKLNETKVTEIFYPKNTADIVTIVNKANQENRAISISGGKHAMGGQQFGSNTIHISMNEMNDVIGLDTKRGIIKVEAGITWPKLIDYLLTKQEGHKKQWSIVQKQTGANELSLGGALSANIHGRGVNLKPIIHDIEGFSLVDSNGKVLQVSRTNHQELFSLAIGGYGLFGVIATVDLRLQPRKKLRRIVKVVKLDELEKKARDLINNGTLYGDFQYDVDPAPEKFMAQGIVSAYLPVSDSTKVLPVKQKLASGNWHKFLELAHTQKSKVFENYSKYYLSTNGNIYWSDLQQLSFYDPSYEEYLKEHIKDYSKGSLMISELYVPVSKLKSFVLSVRDLINTRKIDVVYGVIRLIKKDQESFLNWAKQDYACVIFNIRVKHADSDLEKAKQDFRALIDIALGLNGAYFLTYHRWARKDQVLKAYPQFIDFLKLKLKYDPQERFQSDWYRHYRKQLL